MNSSKNDPFRLDHLVIPFDSGFVVFGVDPSAPDVEGLVGVALSEGYRTMNQEAPSGFDPSWHWFVRHTVEEIE